MMKHAHRASNLANEDVDLVGMFDQTRSYFYGRVTLITFEFACESICSFGETSEYESFFIKALFTAFRLLVGRVSGEELSFVIFRNGKQQNTILLALSLQRNTKGRLFLTGTDEVVVVFFSQKWWFMIPAERLSFSSPAFHLDQHCLADKESCCLLLHHVVLTDLAKFDFVSIHEVTMSFFFWLCHFKHFVVKMPHNDGKHTHFAMP